MINKENFRESLKDIKVKDFDQDLKDLHDLVIDSSQGGSDWEAYDDPPIKRLIDEYFKRLNLLLEKKHAVEPEKKTIEEKKVALPKERKTVKEAKVSPSDNERDPETDFVERLPEEFKFIKRYLSLNGKKKSKYDLLLFINALHRAITTLLIRKTSPYAEQIRYIQAKLVNKHNTMNRPEVYYIPPKMIDELKEIIHSFKVMPSVNLIKRYISLNGRFGVKEKAHVLVEAMKTAIKKGSVAKNDKYNRIYQKMLTNLNTYIKNKNQRVLSIEQGELNGLNGFINEDGKEIIEFEKDANAKSPIPLKILPSQKSRIVNSVDLCNMKFTTLGFKEKWLRFIGDPTRGFSVMVFGKPKFGKSHLCIDFASYLARNHGKVLYVAREEGIDFTLQKKIMGLQHPNLDTIDNLPDSFEGYDFVFLDSINSLGLSTRDIEVLKAHNPNISFVQIYQTTKAGSHRGDNESQHNVDVVIEVPEIGKAIQFGRFNQGGEMEIFNQAA